MRVCASSVARVSHGWPLMLLLLAGLLWLSAAQADEGKPRTPTATDTGVPELCQAADPAATQSALMRMRQSVVEATTPKVLSPGSQPPQGAQWEVLNGRGFNYVRSSVRKAPPHPAP